MPLAIAVLGSAVISGIASNSASKRAVDAAKSAAEASKVDIGALDDRTREIALRNAQESAALEKAMTPEVPELRTAANNAVLSGLRPNAMQDSAVSQLYARMNGGGANTPLLNAAIAKAQSDLALGGQLSIDQRNSATRTGATSAANATGGLGLGRDLAARDLGLSSYAVEQQRLANAAGLSGLELNREQLGANTFLGQFGALNSYYNNQRSQDLAAAQYGQSIAQPVVGLDPSAVANVTVGNANSAGAAQSNLANIYGQQSSNYAQLGGQLLGYGLQAYGSGAGGGAGTPAATGGGYNFASGGWINGTNPYSGATFSVNK